MLLDFNRLKREHNVNITGVIHVGGHIGDELEEYRGVDNLIIFEPQKHCYDQLVAKAERIGIGGKFINCALGNFIGEAEITSDPTGLTGSLLEPGLVVDYPHIVFSEKFMVDVSKMDEEIPADHPYNFLNMMFHIIGFLCHFKHHISNIFIHIGKPRVFIVKLIT